MRGGLIEIKMSNAAISACYGWWLVPYLATWFCPFAGKFSKSRIVYPPNMGVKTTKVTISGGIVLASSGHQPKPENSRRFLSSPGKVSGKNWLFGRNSRNSF